MLALITKANDSYWYQFKEVEKINDLFEIYDATIVEKNEYQDWEKEDFAFWDGFKEKDIPLMQQAEIHITIYNDYVE